ncbi:MAG: Ig-like domain-containing protein [Spirochaetes bacterium]|nr:Ig-like domain-containing protein [Spirochaetota bacterium]
MKLKHFLLLFLVFTLLSACSEGEDFLSSSSSSSSSSTTNQGSVLPEIQDLTWSGDLSVNSIINTSYTFFDPQGDTEGESIKKWYASYNYDGPFFPVDNNKTDPCEFWVFTEHQNKYLKFEITPVDDKNNIGEKVTSEVIGPIPDTTGPHLNYFSFWRYSNSLFFDFSEIVNISSVVDSTNVKLYLDGIEIPGVTSYSFSIFRFAPNSNLEIGNTYWLKVYPGVEDLAGNKLKWIGLADFVVTY